MRPVERDPAYLWDMLTAAREIREFVAGVTLGEFSGNRMLRMATERGFTIIGEAAGRVSAETRAALPQVPWTAIVGKRNIIVHDYYELDDKRIFLAATTDIPELIAILEAALSEIG